MNEEVETTLANLVRAEAERGSRLLRVALMLCEHPPVAEPSIDADGAGIDEEYYARIRARCDAQAAELNALREALGILPGDRTESLVPAAEALRDAEKASAELLKESEDIRDLLSVEGWGPTKDGVQALITGRQDALEREKLLRAEVSALRAKVAELTPGPWIDPAVEPPPLGELIQTLGLGGALSLCSLRPGSTPDDNRWLHRWRRVSAAIVAKPEVGT